MKDDYDLQLEDLTERQTALMNADPTPDVMAARLQIRQEIERVQEERRTARR